MKSIASPKKLLAILLSLVMVCTMLQCVLFTAVASDADIDTLIGAVNEDGKVTLTEAVSVNTIVELYNAMDANKKADYTSDVTDIKNKFFSVLKNGYTPFTASEDVDFTGPRLSEFSYDQWNQLAVVDGCVRYKLNNTGNCGLRIGPRTRMKLDGFEIMFNRLSEIPGLSHNQFRIGLQLTPGNADIASNSEALIDFSLPSTTGVLVHFDFLAGKLIYNLKKSSTDIKYLELSDERLKYENIRYRAFTVGFVKGDSETPLQVIVKIADGSEEPIVLDVPADYYDAAAVESADGNGNVLVGINRGYYTKDGADSTYGQVNLYLDLVGYRNTNAEKSPIEILIDEVDADNVTLDDADEINKISVMYDALGEEDKAKHKDIVDNLKTKLYTLLSDGLDVKTTLKSQFNKDWWGTVVAEADSAIRLTFESAGDPTIAVGPNAGTTESVSSVPAANALDGLEVMINRFYQYQPGDSAGFAIQFTPWRYQSSSYNYIQFNSSTVIGMLLYFDLKNSQIIINSRHTAGGAVNVDTLTLDSEEKAKLTLENFEYKAIAIGMNATTNAEYPYQLTIKISGDTTPIVVDIPAEHYSDSITNNGKVNIGIARGGYIDSSLATSTGKIYTKLDFVGYRNTANIFAANALISAVPEVDAVTTDHGNAIYKAEQAYNALTDYEKTRVDGAKISAARAKYNELVDAETVNEGYTDIIDFNTDKNNSNLVDDINTWFPAYFNLTHLEGNGVKLNWTDAGRVSRMPVKTRVNLDGFSLRFNNYKLVSGTCAELSILFSSNSYNEHKNNGTPHFVVIIDATTGTLKVSTVYDANDTTKQSYYDIIKNNDLLKYENLAGAMFTVDFAAIGEMEYKVTVNVAGESVSGIIPAQAFADVSGTETTSLYNPNYCYFAVGAWSGSTQQVDVVGFKTNETVTETKIEGASLTVSDSISVNYKVNSTILSSSTYVNPEIDFTLADETINVIGELESGTGYYNFTFPNIAPNLMGETITATLYAYSASGGNRVPIGDTVEYSVKQYCYSMLEKYPNDEELCDLIVDLLRYGAESQGYTNKTENGLVTDALTDAQKEFGTAYTAATAGKVILGTEGTNYTTQNKQVTWKSASLFLADVVNIRFKFTLADDANVNDLTAVATVGGNEVEVSADCIEQINDSSSYYLYFDGATAARMRDAVAITFYNANGDAVSKTVNYSIENYIGTQVDKNEDESLVSMLKALLCYGDSAKAYASK